MLENRNTGTIACIISLLPLSRLLTQINFVSYPADTPLEHNPKEWNRWRRWIICFHGSAHSRVCYQIFPRGFSHVEAVFVFLPPAFRMRTPCFKCPRLYTSCQIHTRTNRRPPRSHSWDARRLFPRISRSLLAHQLLVLPPITSHTCALPPTSSLPTTETKKQTQIQTHTGLMMRIELYFLSAFLFPSALPDSSVDPQTVPQKTGWKKG